MMLPNPRFRARILTTTSRVEISLQIIIFELTWKREYARINRNNSYLNLRCSEIF